LKVHIVKHQLRDFLIDQLGVHLRHLILSGINLTVQF